MPLYSFKCNNCDKKFDDLTPYDEKNLYPSVFCPHCGSKEKEKLVTSPNFNFSNPIGTDRWNSESSGHDYRFKHNIPKVQEERKMAESLSHMGKNPYKSSNNDFDLGEGIHDPEYRSGLS